MHSATASSSRPNREQRRAASGILVALFTSLAYPGWTQNATNGTSITTSSFSISPNTGTSTLDQLRPSKGDAIDLQFPSGFSCRVSSGDVPSLIAYGDQGYLSNSESSLASGSRAGVAFILPLYRSHRNICDKSIKLQNAMSQLEIAEKLVTSGAMSNAEFMELSRRIKNLTLGL